MRNLHVFAGMSALALAGPMTRLERAHGRFLRGPEDHPSLTPEQMAENLKKSIDAKHDEVMKKSEEALTEAKKSGTLSTETKSSVDQMLTEVGTMREQLAQIEQKMARKPGSDQDEAKSYGEQVVKSDKFSSFKAGSYQGSARFSLKAITAAQAGTAWSDRDTTVTSLPQRQAVVRDLLTVVPTTSGSVDYARQNLRQNAAAPVAEAAAKPYSSYTWEQVNAAVRVIAHLAKITRQALDDAVQLQGEVDQEMRYGLVLAEEGELLSGDGTGQHLTGMIPNATAYAAPITIEDATMIDTIRLSLLQAELALYPSDGVIMNPADWAHIELTKDAQGRYIWANPLQLGGPTLWGKRVVSTVAMTIDKFLTGGFKLQTLYDRMSPEVLIASENVDDFEKNLYTMRCEERLALANKKPGALIYGDFGNVT
jgi:HK97 family phage major capsid protein